MEPKAGKTTTEWLALIGGVLASVGTIGASILGSGAFPEGTVAYVVIASVVAVAGLVATYINGRSKVKAAASLAVATASAEVTKAANPTP